MEAEVNMRHSGPSWYVVRTHSRKEDLACIHLNRQGFSTYFPKMKRPITKKLGGIHVPLFPSYAFVQLDLSLHRWRAVNSTIGVLSLVQFGSFPSPVPSRLVQDLMNLSDRNGTLLFADDLAAGDSVKIVGGVFDGFIAEVCKAPDAGGRVSLLLEFMSRKTIVEADRGSLIRLPGQTHAPD